MSDLSLHLFGPDSATVVLLAHGAGAGHDSPFMQTMAAGLAERGCRVGLFDFPYMQQARREGRRRPPSAMPKLIESWQEVIQLAGSQGASRLVIGGKSMGGRMASLVADECEVAGLVCLGYPFHPPANPEKTRTEHLAGLVTPTLVVQGERDRFGTPGEVAGYELSGSIRIHWMPDGDHDLVPRKRSGRTAEQNWAEAADAILGFFISIVG